MHAYVTMIRSSSCKYNISVVFENKFAEFTVFTF